MASEQFNCVGAINPVWVEYQSHGGQPSPAMTQGLRQAIWGLSVAAMAFAVAWERVVVQGPAGRWAADKWRARRKKQG
jgi:hypothetical protein